MDRRKFVKLAGLAGLSFLAPLGTPSSQAGTVKYKGPFWIMINASGGWDPLTFCDPHGGADIQRLYTEGQIRKAGNIRYAPVEGKTNGMDGQEVFYTCAQFFDKWYKRLLVVNGIDTTTNNHDAGTRTTWCGQLGEGYPAFAALAASVALSHYDVPLAFLSTGGFDRTEGVCSLSRLGSVDTVQRLAYPNTINPGDDNLEFYNTPNTSARIMAAQAARVQALRDKQTLPLSKNALGQLYLARQGNAGLEGLAKELDGVSLVEADNIPEFRNLEDQGSVGDAVNLMQQAQLALLAFKSGVAVSANINIGGFDTHSNHDQDGVRQALQLLRGFAYILEQADKMGLSDQVYVIAGSDFGRTPTYNEGDGKDHWNITSMLFSGPRIEGNKVIGTTDAGYVAKEVNVTSLKPDAGGIRIGTPNIHRALRKLAGVTGSEADTLFPLVADDMPIFG
jgi:uncharacterized protein (DUF1501 family)